MADELEILYSHLLRAKTAIYPFLTVATTGSNPQLHQCRRFLESIEGLHAHYARNPLLANQLGIVLQELNAIVQSIEYAAVQGNVSKVLADTTNALERFQGPGGILASMKWEALPGGGGVLPEPPEGSPDKPALPPASDPNKPATNPTKGVPSAKL
jgi:hypothetical protein